MPPGPVAVSLFPRKRPQRLGQVEAEAIFMRLGDSNPLALGAIPDDVPREFGCLGRNAEFGDSPAGKGATLGDVVTPDFLGGPVAACEGVPCESLLAVNDGVGRSALDGGGQAGPR